MIALVVVLVASSLLSAAAPGSVIPHPATTSAPDVAALAAAPEPRNLTFYMHNTTVAQTINGVSTPFTFDTFQRFGRNNTVSKVQSVRQDWRLYPVLAGPLTLNGTVSLNVFVSIDQAGAQITPTLDISEINATGGTTWSNSVSPGSFTWWTSPHDLVLTTLTLHHTFEPGSTILIVVTITSGVRLATIWYNASWVPTQVILQSNDFARIHDIAFLNPAGASKLNFDPTASNKTIRIQANVTDPLGGYDIHWVNLTLVEPGGATILTNAPMALVSGTPVSYASVYQVSWNYTGRPTGRYNATASVVDQTGFYFFQSHYTTAGFLDSMDAFFYIGGLPEYVNVKAVDSESAPLVGAHVVLLSGGVAVDALASDSAGMANFTLEIGAYTFQVYWQGILVDSQAYTATANVSAANPLLLTSTVYYPDFHAEDANGVALGDASIVFLHPNGSKIGPYKTNATGDVLLSQVPGGTYGLEVSWRGVGVYTGNQSVSSNGAISFETAVYELTVTAKSGSGSTLPGVFVSVVDSTGLVFDAGVTGSDGTVVLRLPGGSYTIQARYITDQLGTLYDSGTRTQIVSLTGSSSATITFADFPLPVTSTLAFLFGIVYAVTVAALLVVFLFLLPRLRKDGKDSTESSEKKE